MKRQPLWSDTEIDCELRGCYGSGIVLRYDSVLPLIRQIRDDLQAALDKRTQTCMYLLRANGRLRQRIAELERALAITQLGYDVAIAQLEGANDERTD
jgi:hypothetical protein